MKTPKLIVTPFKNGDITRESAAGLISINVKCIEDGKLKKMVRPNGKVEYVAAQAPLVAQMSNQGAIVEMIGDDFVEGFDLNAWYLSLEEEVLQEIASWRNVGNKLITEGKSDDAAVMFAKADTAYNKLVNETCLRVVIRESLEPMWEGQAAKSWDGEELLTKDGQQIYRETFTVEVGSPIQHVRIAHVNADADDALKAEIAAAEAKLKAATTPQAKKTAQAALDALKVK